MKPAAEQHTTPLDEEFARPDDFRRRARTGLAIAGVLLLAPFAINNFFQERWLLGIGALIIVASLIVDQWGARRGKDLSPLMLWVLIPAILAFLSVSISRQGVIGVLWCYPAVTAMYIVLPERRAWFANTLLLILALPLAQQVLDAPVAARMAVTLVAVSLFSAIFIRVISGQQKRLHQLAVSDSLTGLFDRTLLDETLQSAVDQRRRAGVPMSLIILDLDHFKAINDTHGHDTGDRVLKGVAELLTDRLRRTDGVFRMGGEEFLIVLFNTQPPAANALAEELRQAVESSSFVPDVQMTASLGLAMLEDDEDWESWMKRADKHLYQAKSAGRNQVVFRSLEDAD